MTPDETAVQLEIAQLWQVYGHAFVAHDFDRALAALARLRVVSPADAPGLDGAVAAVHRVRDAIEQTRAVIAASQRAPGAPPPDAQVATIADERARRHRAAVVEHAKRLSLDGEHAGRVFDRLVGAGGVGVQFAAGWLERCYARSLPAARLDAALELALAAGLTSFELTRALERCGT